MNTDNKDGISLSVYSQYANVNETYSMLYSSLVDAFDNQLDFFNKQSEDYFEIILEKINYVRNIKNLDPEELEQMNQIKRDLYGFLEEKFTTIYNVDLNNIFNIYGKEFIFDTIYKVFFQNKREFIVQYLLNYFNTNKKALANQYKGQLRKDASYTQIKTEIELKNTAFYPILYCYQEIIFNLINSDNTDITDFTSNISLTTEESILMNTIFQDSIQNQEYIIYMTGLTSWSDYPDFVSEFRERLFDQFRSL
jgi:DNA-binding phage protein